jgi:threonine/homoserine/homoserine lactone efflux protein
MLFLLALTVPFTERNSSTFVIIVLGAIHLLVVMAILSALLYLDWDPFRAFKN